MEVPAAPSIMTIRAASRSRKTPIRSVLSMLKERGPGGLGPQAYPSAVSRAISHAAIRRVLYLALNCCNGSLCWHSSSLGGPRRAAQPRRNEDDHCLALHHERDTRPVAGGNWRRGRASWHGPPDDRLPGVSAQFRTRGFGAAVRTNRP